MRPGSGTGDKGPELYEVLGLSKEEMGLGMSRGEFNEERNVYQRGRNPRVFSA